MKLELLKLAATQVLNLVEAKIVEYGPHNTALLVLALIILALVLV
jgi:hypothetical protein